MPRGDCLICERDADLQESHILPAFVFRWLRNSAAGGHLRHAETPNRRIQDGLKRYWLCSGCEQRLGDSESTFASRLFHPYTVSSGKRVRYSRWLNYFCTSVSWRVLRFYLEEDHLSDWDAGRIAHVRSAESSWRNVLLEGTPHARKHQQHLLPLDRIESASGELPPNINRYLMRAVDMDICRGNDSIFTYAKIGRFVIIGFVHEPELRAWKGTKVHANEGLIEPRKYVLPKPFGDYMMGKARRMAEVLRSISPAQNEKIDAAFRANADNFVGSDAYEAMMADISMFGEEAFSREEEDPAE